MAMQMLLKNNCRFVLVLFFGLLSGCLEGFEKTEVGRGYYFVDLGDYQRFLANDKNLIVVPPIVIDYVEYEGGFVFVRQLTKEFTCDSGALRVGILGEFEYWDLHEESEYKLTGPFQRKALKSTLSERINLGEWEALDFKLDAIIEASAFSSHDSGCN